MREAIVRLLGKRWRYGANLAFVGLHRNNNGKKLAMTVALQWQGGGGCCIIGGGRRLKGSSN